MDTRNVLVTGGAGYIGSEVVTELVRRGHRTTVLDTFFFGSDSLDHLKGDVTLIQGDCRNSKDVLYALQNQDSVIHLAGIVGEPACKVNPLAHYATNIEATRTLVNCCTAPQCSLIRDLVFSSSCSVYGNVRDMVSEVTETTTPLPLSEYADAKRVSEEIVLARGKEVPYFHPTVLRLTTLFGWSYRPRIDLVTNAFTYQAWTHGTITISGDGQQYRSLIHVKDTARAFVAVLESPRYMRSNQIFHVGEEENNKRLSELAALIKSALPRTNIVYRKDHPTDRRDYFINCAKIKNAIGWKAQLSVEEGISDLIQHFEANRPRLTDERYRNNTFRYQ